MRGSSIRAGLRIDFMNGASLGDGALRTRGGAVLVAYKPDEIADAAWEIQERGHQLRETKERTWRVAAQFSVFAPVVEGGGGAVRGLFAEGGCACGYAGGVAVGG